MKIKNVQATTHDVAVDVPLLDDKPSREIVFVEIETDTGITGYGLTSKRQWFGIRALINKEMRPLLEGMSPLQNEKIWDKLQRILNRRVQTGAWCSAISAVDIALWDIKGKYFDAPIWELLGGFQEEVPAYVTFGLGAYSKTQLQEVARKFVDEGFSGLKMVVAIDGGTNPIEDANRVGAVRDEIGEDVDLMVDANYQFSINRALDLSNRVEQYNLTWFEEPVYGNDTELLATLRNRTRIPIAAGQNEGHRFRHRALMESGAIDISNPNVVYGGGFTECNKIAAMAQSYNLDIANGAGFPLHNMHLHAGLSNGWYTELHLVTWGVEKLIFTNPPTPTDGMLPLPDGPGLGLEPDREILSKFQVEEP